MQQGIFVAHVVIKRIFTKFELQLRIFVVLFDDNIVALNNFKCSPIVCNRSPIVTI